MTLQELYTALCALWGVDEIEDEYAILLGDTVLDMVACPPGHRPPPGGPRRHG